MTWLSHRILFAIGMVAIDLCAWLARGLAFAAGTVVGVVLYGSILKGLFS